MYWLYIQNRFLLHHHRVGAFLGSTITPSQHNPLLEAHPSLVEFRLFQEIPAFSFGLFFGLFVIIHHARTQAILTVGTRQDVIINTAGATFPKGIVGGQFVCLRGTVRPVFLQLRRAERPFERGPKNSRSDRRCDREPGLRTQQHRSIAREPPHSHDRLRGA